MTFLLVRTKRQQTSSGKMCDRNGTFVALTLFLILFCDSTSSECTQTGPCFCRLPDGDYYDFTGLADKKTLIDTNSNWVAYFQPCKNVQIVDDNNKTCANENGTSLCLHDKQNNRTDNLGTIQETKMKLSEDNKFIVFEIRHGDNISVIDTICNPDNNTRFIIGNIDLTTKRNSFSLISPHSCKKLYHGGLSTGSILVILLFTFSGIYIIGGAVALKALRGATGWEMLPNHDFWCDFPSLVRDGIIFTFNCCRADSYERI